jgi:hypothetical protein
MLQHIIESFGSEVMDRNAALTRCFQFLALCFLVGCVTAANRLEERRSDITGAWVGISQSSCGAFVHAQGRCLAIQKITFTLVEGAGAKISGYYRCSYGSAPCLNMLEVGKVSDGALRSKLLTMRVLMEDGSDCIFNGMPKNQEIRGGYICLQGGGIVEKGTWEVRRSY